MFLYKAFGCQRGCVCVSAIDMVVLEICFNRATENGKHYDKLKGAFRHSHECALVLHFKILEILCMMQVFI